MPNMPLRDGTGIEIQKRSALPIMFDCLKILLLHSPNLSEISIYHHQIVISHRNIWHYLNNKAVPITRRETE